jgi:hypothetical protein
MAVAGCEQLGAVQGRPRQTYPRNNAYSCTEYPAGPAPSANLSTARHRPMLYSVVPNAISVRGRGAAADKWEPLTACSPGSSIARENARGFGAKKHRLP